jgi:5-methylthioadenosine/S-adenosylhomocysteine deaminase
MNSLAAEDVEIVVRNGICVVACVQSDLRLGSGVCPVQQLNDRQVTVGLGTGDAASVGALDILTEARAAVLANAGDEGAAAPAPAGLTCEEALRMATLGGATALGLSSLIGSIEPGKAADLACFDLNSLSCHPAVRAAQTLLFGAVRQQASDVWTSGRAALSDGQLLTFDEQELAALADRWARRLHLEDEV